MAVAAKPKDAETAIRRVTSVPFAVVVLLAIWLAALTRLPYVFESFPLGDGGMFASVIGDIRADGVPRELSYNGEDLPFAYPPFTFYLAAGFAEVFGTGPNPWLVILPVGASLATVGAFALLARRLAPSPEAAGLAVVFFALIPRSYTWEIIGGGLTRSFGFLFAILALHQAVRMYDERARWAWPLAGVFMALTVLSHIEFGWFGTFAFALLLLARAADRRAAVFDTAKAAALCVLLVSPWLAIVIAEHGLDPFLSAMRSSNHSVYSFLGPLQALRPNSLGEPFLPIFLVLSLLGALRSLKTGRWLLPAFLLMVLLLDPRKGQTEATIAVALLAAVAVWEVLIPMLGPRRPEGSLSRPQKAFLQGLVAFGALAALASGLDRWSPLARLPDENREAMAWIRENTPDNARFAVVTGDERWWLDITSEWFPALAERHSVATVQGSEWNERYGELEESSEDLQSCALVGIDCLDAWEAEHESSFDHIYVPIKQRDSLGDDDAPCCQALVGDLQRDSRFEQIYADEGGWVFRRR